MIYHLFYHAGGTILMKRHFSEINLYTADTKIVFFKAFFIQTLKITLVHFKKEKLGTQTCCTFGRIKQIVSSNAKTNFYFV